MKKMVAHYQLCSKVGEQGTPLTPLAYAEVVGLRRQSLAGGNLQVLLEDVLEDVLSSEASEICRRDPPEKLRRNAGIYTGARRY